MKHPRAVLLLGLILLVAACGGGQSTTPPSETPETPAVHQFDLSGKIIDWPTGETAKLEARHEKGALLGTSTVATDGSFEVTVSPPTTFRRYAEVYFECEHNIINTIELSNPEARLARLLMQLPVPRSGVIAEDSIGLRDHADTQEMTRFAILSYVDTPLTISGRIRCGDIPGYIWTGVYEDTHFNVGWNVVVQTPTFAADGELTEVQYEAFPVSRMPDDIDWYLSGYVYAR